MENILAFNLVKSTNLRHIPQDGEDENQEI
jgi:hypothetical protein